MITRAEVEKYRAELEEEYAAIPPTEVDTVEWHARHEEAVRLHGAIQALTILLDRMHSDA